MRNFNPRNSGRGRPQRDDQTMHRTTCAECGMSCEVPFKPTGNKPVYCNSCFKKDQPSSRSDRGGYDGGRNDRGGRGGYDGGRNDRGGRGGYDGGRNDRDDRESRSFHSDRGGRNFSSNETTMHQAICDECGERCEVPFRPSGEKPVYCSDCFRKDTPSSNKSVRIKDNVEKTDKNHDEINEKLDKILIFLRRLNPFKDKSVDQTDDLKNNAKAIVSKPVIDSEEVKQKIDIVKPKKAVKKDAVKKVPKQSTVKNADKVKTVAKKVVAKKMPAKKTIVKKK